MKFLNQKLFDTNKPCGDVFYPLEEFKRALEDVNFQKRINCGALLGELGSPVKKEREFVGDFNQRCVIVDVNNVSHQIENVVLKEDGVVYGDVTLVGPKAKFLNTLTGYHFGVRAVMNLVLVDGVFQPVPGTLHLVTFDLIAD